MSKLKDKILSLGKLKLSLITAACLLVIVAIIAVPLAFQAEPRYDFGVVWRLNSNNTANKVIVDALTPLALTKNTTVGDDKDKADTQSQDNATLDVGADDGATATSAPNNGSTSSGGTASGGGTGKPNPNPGGGGNSDPHAGQTWHEGWWEQVPVYETHTVPGYYEPMWIVKTLCNTCGIELTAGSIGPHFDLYPTHSGWHDANVQTGQKWIDPVTTTTITGYNQVWHDGYWS